MLLRFGFYIFQDFHSRWEVDVFGGYDNDNNNKISSKSNDDDLFRLAKSHLLLLFIIISLFVVNVTTMPWTMLLGITFITPFVFTAVSFSILPYKSIICNSYSHQDNLYNYREN